MRCPIKQAPGSQHILSPLHGHSPLSCKYIILATIFAHIGPDCQTHACFLARGAEARETIHIHQTYVNPSNLTACPSQQDAPTTPSCPLSPCPHLIPQRPTTWLPRAKEGNSAEFAHVSSVAIPGEQIVWRVWGLHAGAKQCISSSEEALYHFVGR